MEAFAVTSRASWNALGPEEQWTLFSRVEMDAICAERALRQQKEGAARQVGELKERIRRFEAEDEKYARIERERSDDAWKRNNANRILRRQLEEAGITPLA